MRKIKNQILILFRRRGVMIGLAFLAYVFVVFILPDLIFTRQHVLYREDINSAFNQRMQRYINAQIIASCPLIKRDLVLIDERLTNKGSNFYYTTTFNYKHNKELPGEIQMVELSNGHIELKLMRCPGQEDGRKAAGNRDGVKSSEKTERDKKTTTGPTIIVQAEEQTNAQMQH